MASRFSGVTANERHLGFWQSWATNRIVCRADGRKRVLLVRQENSDGELKWSSSNPGVATAEFVGGGPPGELLVEITGGSAGITILTLFNDSSYVESVIVYVYAERTVKVNFFRVNDGQQPKFTLSQVGSVLAKVNALYKYQANVVFEPHLTENLTGAPDFSARTQSDEKLEKLNKWLKDRLNQYDPSAAYINVFSVKKYGATEGKAGQPDRIFGATVVRTVIVEDVGGGGTNDMALLIGHELGHALAKKSGHSDLPGSLMAERPTHAHRHIYPQDVLFMRGAPA